MNSPRAVAGNVRSKEEEDAVKLRMVLIDPPYLILDCCLNGEWDG